MDGTVVFEAEENILFTDDDDDDDDDAAAAAAAAAADDDDNDDDDEKEEEEEEREENDELKGRNLILNYQHVFYRSFPIFMKENSKIPWSASTVSHFSYAPPFQGPHF